MGNVGTCDVGVFAEKEEKMMESRLKWIAAAMCACLLTGGAPFGGTPFEAEAPSGKIPARAETFSAEWEVHEDSEISVREVREGGVGTIVYRTVPKEDGSSEYPYGNPDGPIRNSVRIPCRGYDISDDRISVKYQADFPVGGQSIALYASLSEDVGTDGKNLPAQDVLIGWFENWNVTSGQSKDGFKYITVDHSNYTDFRTVNGLILQFNYEGDSGTEKTIRLFGIDIHPCGQTPSFVTDPQPFSLSAPIAENCTAEAAEDGGWTVALSGTGKLSFEAKHWDPALADLLAVDCAAFEGASMTPILDGMRGNTVSLSESRTVTEIEVNAQTLGRVTLEFTGTGILRLYSVTATTVPKVANWSTSNGSYFDLMEESDDPVYQMHYKRNRSAGYPKVIVSVENWRAEYDIVCINIEVLSGKLLPGILLSDQNYLLSHWETENILGEGEYEFTFYNPLEIDPAWDGSSLIFYVNPNSVSGEGYTYDAEFKIGFQFMKSSDLPAAQIEVAQEEYVFPYDGEKKAVTAVVTPKGTPYSTLYILDGHFSENPPSAVGEYIVRFETEGTRELRRAVKEVRLVIASVEQERPAEGDWSFNYDAVTVLLQSGIEASYSSSFDTLIPSGGEIEPGSVLYVRRAATEGALPSDFVETRVPGRPEYKPDIVVSKCTRTQIALEPEKGVEYRLVTDSVPGDWKDGSSFLGLKADTLYVVEARIKAADGLFAGEISSLEVRTASSSDSSDYSDSSDNPASPENAGASGCGSVFSPLLLAGILLFPIALCKKK